MRKIYLLFSLILIFIGCEKDEINHSLDGKELHQETNLKRLKEISFKKLPAHLRDILDNKNLIKTNNGKSNKYFGSVNLNKPVQEIIDEDGNSSFTFLLNKKKDTIKSIYFDNLVIFEKGKEEALKYIIRYEPTLEWYKNSRKFEDFSGKIIFYTLEGKAFNNLYLEEGRPSSINQKSGCLVELKSVVTVCTDGGSIGGEGSSIDETCVTTYNYEVNCSAGGGSPSGGDDGGAPNGPGPGGGDGSNDGSGSDGEGPIDFEPVEGWTPPSMPDEEDPCAQMEALESDDSFKERMEDLADKTDLDYETGYLLSVDNDEYTYTEINGEPGEDGIDLPNNMEIINGYMHTHYSGLYSTFSGSDVRAIYQLFQNGNITNLESFAATVTTDHGTTYSLKINSTSDFLDFASNNLNNDTNFRSFENLYNNWFEVNTALGYTEIDSREIALLKALENSGLKLFKGNSSFTDWNLIELNNNTVINNDCN